MHTGTDGPAPGDPVPDTSGLDRSGSDRSGTDELRAHLTRRRGEIADRIRQLHERSRELSDRAARGTTPDELARARACVTQARAHAREAHERAATRHDLATEAHLRAAALLDARGRPELAQQHRVAAEIDREGGVAERDAAARDA